MVAIRRKNEIGITYFQQTPINWSTRRRGNVQRSHICTTTSPNPLAKKISGLDPNGPTQPPRNSSAASIETSSMFPYSARKKNANRMPLYSVWNPATSSDSASGMSKGVRFVSASPQMKNRTKAIRLSGNSWKISQSPTPRSPPDWAATMSGRCRLPTWATTTRIRIAVGIS